MKSNRKETTVKVTSVITTILISDKIEAINADKRNKSQFYLPSHFYTIMSDFIPG
jgi:hypothetical protein